MDEARLIHIAAGTLSIAAGATALIARKGAPAHRAAGAHFVVAMIGMATTAAIIGKKDAGNIVAGALTIYSVLTGWATARRGEKTAGRFEGVAGLVALSCALGGYWSAYLIATGAKAADNPYIVTATIIISTVMALAAIGDFSVVLRRGLAGRQRIARHLWRMCFGLVIAVGSFAAQGARVLPDWFPGGPAILASLGVVIATMAFWLARVFFTGWLAHPARPLSTGKE